ncbi:MAG: acyltransferase 3 [Frankiales bacterium]|nr:acyltransferase 3 [Frankiales bacterium]
MSPSSANRALNVMRAAAAITVCVGHVRAYLLKPLEGNHFGAPTRVAYALTSLGHGAVMVFFVLSGYFVGGSVLRDRARGSFRWADYLTARTLRLWLVLAPALLLTALLDRIGRHAYPHSEMYGDTARAVVNSGLGDMVGNLFFLQPHVVPVYGSNGPLWSLGYEYAYYLLFPLVVVGVAVGTGRARRLAAVPVIVAVALVTGPQVMALFVTWVAGALIAWKEPALRARVGRLGGLRNAARVVTLSALVGAMCLDKVLGGGVGHPTVGTYATAVCTAALVVLYLPDVRPRHAWVDSALTGSGHLAESSYSLYAYHLPVLALFSTVLTPNGRAFTGSHRPDLTGWGLVLGVALALIAGGWLFARGTEHYYKPLRDRAISSLSGQRRPARAASSPGGRRAAR